MKIFVPISNENKLDLHIKKIYSKNILLLFTHLHGGFYQN